ncbi:MAG: hypothetical protein V7607_1523 [Solirubrobacteraceae bacterium]
MTSREHARRLMLILLASEGTALRQAADERTLRRRDQSRSARLGTRSNDSFTAGFIASGHVPSRSSEAMS